jgi:hypothetical protein
MHNSIINMAAVDLFGNEPSFATSVDGYMRVVERDFGLDVCNVDFIGTYIDHVVGSFVSNDMVLLFHLQLFLVVLCWMTCSALMGLG